MKALSTAAMAIVLMAGATLSDTALAEQNRSAGRQEAWRDAQDQPRQKAARGAGPSRQKPLAWRKGQILPPEQRKTVIRDPSRYGLYAPPRGHAWIRLGDDVYLVAQASGQVVEVLRDSR